MSVIVGCSQGERELYSVFRLFHRKICKTCKCKPEEHDIKSAEEEAHKLVVHSLFSKDSPVGHIRDYFRKLEEANNTQRSEYARQFAWTPPGLQQGVVGIQDLCYCINYFLAKPF